LLNLNPNYLSFGLSLSYSGTKLIYNSEIEKEANDWKLELASVSDFEKLYSNSYSKYLLSAEEKTIFIELPGFKKIHF
jgi:hypothetical protein